MKFACVQVSESVTVISISVHCLPNTFYDVKL